MTQINSTRVVCPLCGYDDNPSTATNCLNCNHRLHSQPSHLGDRNALPKRGGIPWSVVPLAGLLLATLGLFFLWRNQSPTPPSSQPPAFSATSPHEWQLYNSMRDVPDVPQGVYLYGGAMASAALRSKSVLNEIARAHPEFRLLYTDPLSVPPDSGKGIEMVANGELSFAESFRPIRQSEYNLASSRGFTLKQVPVALGGLAFYSHPRVKLPDGISLGQIQDIYSGKITNWRQLGGPDLPIVPISQDPDAKAATSFLLQGMPSSQRRFSKNVRIVRDTTTAIRRVATTPGGFGYGAQALVAGQRSIQLLDLAKGRSHNFIPPANPDGTVNKEALRDGSYPIIRRIFVVYREDGSLDEIAGRAYANLLLSAEGQKLVDRAGYLPIR